MHFLLGIAAVSGAIWLAIEFPKFRKALVITGIGFALFCVWAAWLLTARPS